MDPIDAVRDQLQASLSALRERLNQVTSALEQATSSVQSILSEPDGQLLRLAQVEAAVAALQAAPGGVSLDVIRRLDDARSQSDLLHELMGILTDHAARAVVLVFRSGAVSAWSGVGFADGDVLERWQGEVAGSHALAAIERDPRPLRLRVDEDPLISRWLAGVEAPEDALLVPVSLRGKVMGAFYVDRVAGSPWDPDSVQALIAIGCWLIDTLHHRTAVPTPMVAAVAEVEVAAPGPTPTAEVFEPAEEPPAAARFEREPEITPEPAAVESAEVGPVEYEVAVPQPPAEAEFEIAEGGPPEFEEEPAEPAFDPSATLQVDLGEMVEEVTAPEELELDLGAEPVVERAPAEELELDLSAEAAVESPPAEPAVEAPPPVLPVAPPPGFEAEPEVGEPEVAPALSPEDETRHEEARRFARLLVSEIKLYNEEEVDRGRANRDLYQRLKEDVDRSREMYEKRISPDIRAARDYFHEELVRILGDGDPDTLGM